MINHIRKLLFTNLGAKLLALFFALAVWTLITIKEKTFRERTLRVPIEFTQISEQIEVVSAKPEAVQVTIQGSSRAFQDFDPDKLRIRIDLHEIDKSGHYSFFAEDYLDIPAPIKIVSLNPKMVEVNVEQLGFHEVPVQLRFRNRLAAGLRLVGFSLQPDKVTVFGYEDRVRLVRFVETEEIDLNLVSASGTFQVSLKKPAQVMNIRDVQRVDVQLTIEKASTDQP